MTDEPIEEEPHFELLMPFVVTTSHGGPFDDDAYVAGWEAGQVDQKLQMSNLFGLPMPRITCRTANVPQMELIAMKAGMLLGVVNFEDELDGWSLVTFQRTGMGDTDSDG